MQDACAPLVDKPQKYPLRPFVCLGVDSRSNKTMGPQREPAGLLRFRTKLSSVEIELLLESPDHILDVSNGE